MCTCKCTFFNTKQFRFNQFRRNCRTVDRNKSMFFTLTEFMHTTGKGFFPDPCFTLQQNGNFGTCGFFE